MTTIVPETPSAQTFNFMSQPQEGLVFLGCGGNLQEWYDGIMGDLESKGLANRNDFQPYYKVTTTGGRTDLVFPFKSDHKIDIGKLALWRLIFGDCSWISDYVVNYADQHQRN